MTGLPTTQLTQVDGGLQLVIPAEVAALAGLQAGHEVTLKTASGSVTAERARKRYCLAQLLAGTTPEHLHRETAWGPSVGRERFWE